MDNKLQITIELMFYSQIVPTNSHKYSYMLIFLFINHLGNLEQILQLGMHIILTPIGCLEF